MNEAIALVESVDASPETADAVSPLVLEHFAKIPWLAKPDLTLSNASKAFSLLDKCAWASGALQVFRSRVLDVYYICACVELCNTQSDTLFDIQELKGYFIEWNAEESDWVKCIQNVINLCSDSFDVLVRFIKTSIASEDAFFINNWDKFVPILQIPYIKQQLDLELKFVETTVNSNLLKIKQHISTIPSGDIADYILSIRQAEACIKEFDNIAEFVCDSEYNAKRVPILIELSKMEEKGLLDWQTYLKINSDPLKLILDPQGLLRVVYPDHLAFLTTVRRLLGYKCKIDDKITTMSEEANKTFKTALKLRNVANLYNNLDSKVRWFHKPLMLDAAFAFENCVKMQPVSWSDTKINMKYLKKLTSVAGDLEKINNQLISAHSIILKKLGNVDNVLLILRQQADSLNVKDADMGPWRYHLQMQQFRQMAAKFAENVQVLATDLMYKNEGCDFLKHLPEIKSEARLKGTGIILKPSIDTIKSQFYASIHKILYSNFSPRCIFPTGAATFKNFVLEVFESHAEILEPIFKMSTVLFDDFEKQLSAYNDWFVIRVVACNSVTDFEEKFKNIKLKGKEIDNIPNAINIENLSCSLLPLKAIIESQLQTLYDTLVSSLSESLKNDCDYVNSYLESGSQVLNEKPNNVEDIAKAQISFNLLSEKANEVKIHLDFIQSKQKLLSTVIQSSFTDSKPQEYSHLIDHYDKFESSLLELKNATETESEKIKSDLKTKIQEFEITASNLLRDLKQRNTSFSLDYNDCDVQIFEEMILKIDQLEIDMAQLENDCSFFGLEPPVSTFKECQSFIKQVKDSKMVFEEFEKIVRPLLCLPIIVLSMDTIDSLVSNFKLKFPIDNPAFLQVNNTIENISLIKSEWNSLFADVSKFGPQHWNEMGKILGTTDSKITLNHLIANDSVVKNRKELFELSLNAREESIVKESIQEIEIWAVNSIISVSSAPLIIDCKKFCCELRDYIAVISSLQITKNVSNYNEVLVYWEKRLADTDICLRLLMKLQKKWLYLSPIISSLSKLQQSNFSLVDSFIRDMLTKIKNDPRPLQFFSAFESNMNTQLSNYVGILECCQKSLIDFLEKKRLSFPRFFFIGDENLLELLTQASTNSNVIQANLKKLFSGIKEVVIEEERVTQIVSYNGEHVSLKHSVEVSNNVDEWLSQLHLEIQKTLANYLDFCMTDLSGKSIKESVPAQIKDLVYRINMTTNIEKAIESRTLKDLLEPTPHNSHESVYYRRIIQHELIANNVASLKDFNWTKIMRFYYMGRGKCAIRAFEAEYKYSFEYQGNHTKLVQSILTDVCFGSLTHAMAEGYGGCLYGVAGTGKTESVKHLGYLFGRQVLVFNCDEALDLPSLTRIFCGLIRCGVWGCFDEFNRLKSSVLAAVSNVISDIQIALLKKCDSVMIGTKIPINHDANIFVTLNPAGKLYKGRQKLPDNLKQLFRNVCMTHPNCTYICQTELKMLGFKDSDDLGLCVVDLFTTCSQLLSQQIHYDWGLRALKSVVNTAGKLIRVNPENTEKQIVYNSIKTSIEGKLCSSADKSAFSELLVLYFGVQNCIVKEKDSLAKLTLKPHPHQTSAIEKFQDACLHRMGVCLVGPSLSGKFSLVKIVAELHCRCKVIVISPKSMPKSLLFGNFDYLTREWEDGIVTHYCRETLNDHDCHYYLVFDGSVDPEWIEAVNSALDDNRFLSLPNGERIKFEENTNFVFITDSLSNASPATISRLGIIHFDTSIEAEQDCTLVVGNLASGKKKALKNDSTFQIWFHCSSESISSDLITIIMKYCNLLSSSTGQVLTPKVGKSVNLVVCNIDLPNYDVYGSSQVQEFLHQLIKHKGFYMNDSMDWISANALIVSATCSDVSRVSPRLLSKFKVLEQSEDISAFLQSSDLNVSLISVLNTLLPILDVCSLKRWIFEISSRTFLQTPEHLYQVGAILTNICHEQISKAIEKEFGTFNICSKVSVCQTLRDSAEANSFVDLLETAIQCSLPVINIFTKCELTVQEIVQDYCKEHLIVLKIFSYSKSVSIPAFLIQFKDAIYHSGIKNTNVVALINSYSCPNPRYLHQIHRYISGHIYQEIAPDHSEIEQDYIKTGGCDNIDSFVMARCYKNLKIVLINPCTDWMKGFPFMISRASTLYFKELSMLTFSNLLQPLPQNLQDKMINKLFSQLSHSPVKLVNILNMYKTLTDTKTRELQKRKEFLEIGMNRLAAASDSIKEMSLDAEKQTADLKIKQCAADVTLKQITDTLLTVSNQKAEMQVISDDLSQEESALGVKKQEIEHKLSSVEPQLNAAKMAVSEIKVENLNEVRSLRAPPVAVRDVLEGVLRLLGQEDMSWVAMKGFLGKKTFKDEVLNFDVKKTTPKILSQLDALLNQKPDSFIEANAKKASIAAAPLATWVIANAEYAKAYQKIAPLQTTLSGCNQKIEASRARIEELNMAVSTVDERVLVLKIEFVEKTREVQIVESQLQETKNSLAKAKSLLISLESEVIRWQDDLKNISNMSEKIDKYSLVSAFFMNFAGSMNEEERSRALDEWIGIFDAPEYDFCSFANGTQKCCDKLSHENICISNLAKDISIWVADGNGIGLDEITKYYKNDETFKTISIQSDTFAKEVEIAIRLGRTFLLSDVTRDIHAWLYPIIRREFEILHGRKFLYLANKQIEVNSNYKVFLYSPFSGWVLPAALDGYVIQLTWSTTAFQLESRLIKLVTEAQSPELLKEIENMEQDELIYSTQLLQSENEILSELNQDSNALLGSKLLQVLSESKSKAEKASHSLNESRKLSALLQAKQQKYIPLAKTLINVYFLLRKFPKIDEKYRYNLKTFISWFEEVIHNTLKRNGTIKEIESEMLSKVYKSAINGVDDVYRVPIGLCLLKACGKISTLQLKVLCGCIISEEEKEFQIQPLSNWTPDQTTKLNQVSSVVDFKKYFSLETQEEWRRWLNEDIVSVPWTFPGSMLEKALIVSALSPYKLYPILEEITSVFGKFEKNLLDTILKSKSPIFVYVPPGSDALSCEVSEYALKANKEIKMISLGQGLAETVGNVIRNGMHKNMWIIVQNLQASPEWIPECIVLVNEFKEKAHNDSRMVITYEASANVPIDLLEACTLFYLQPVRGFRQTLEGLMKSVDQDCRSTQEAHMLFLISWFHSIIQERRQYVPQGWSSAYEFGKSEYLSSIKAISNGISNVRGLISIIYGARIDGKVDSTTMRYLLDSIMSEDTKMRTSKRLIKDYNIPSSEKISDYIESLDQLNVPESTILMLPANVNSTLNYILSEQTCKVVQLLLFRSSTVKTTNIESVFRKEWYRCTCLPEIQEQKGTIQLGLMKQYTLVLQKIANIKLDSQEAKKAYITGITPEKWQTDLITQPNILLFPIDLETKCKNLIKAIEGNLTLRIPYPKALLSLIKIDVALEQKLKPQNLHLYGAFTPSFNEHVKMELHLQGATIQNGKLEPITEPNAPCTSKCTLYITYMETVTKENIEIPIYTDNTRTELVALILVVSEYVISERMYVAGLALII